MKKLKKELETNGLGFTPVPSALLLGQEEAICILCLKYRSACQSKAAGIVSNYTWYTCQEAGCTFACCGLVRVRISEHEKAHAAIK
jgi:hypothetical protein